MKLIATMPVRNEAWVLGLSARVALMWNDALVILNHGSTDGTIDIIADLQAEFPGRVHCESVPTDRWDEMDHRQLMLEGARRLGATHISIVDADEILTANITSLVPPNLLGVMLTLPLYNMRGSPTWYHASGGWARRETSVAFRDDAAYFWRPSDHLGAIAYQHHRREPQGVRWGAFRPISHGVAGIMHLWGVTERRLMAKHALYKMRDRIRHPELEVASINRMYNQAIIGRPLDNHAHWQYAEAPAEWWAGYAHLMKYLDLKAIPSQEAECKKLLDRYGHEPFAELDLFGVV